MQCNKDRGRYRPADGAGMLQHHDAIEKTRIERLVVLPLRWAE